MSTVLGKCCQKFHLDVSCHSIRLARLGGISAGRLKHSEQTVHWASSEQGDKQFHQVHLVNIRVLAAHFK